MSTTTPDPFAALADDHSRVLIVGASMAGLSAAIQLSAVYDSITVVERSPDLRLTGSPIDVRGEALDTAARMGILDAIRARRVDTSGRDVFTTFVDTDGAPIAQLPLDAANDSDDDIEISREALVDILHGAVDDSVTFRYRDWPTAIVETDDGVDVTFAAGDTRTFDTVVGADGIHSSVRRLALGPESEFRRHLDVYYAIVDLPLGTAGIVGESRTFNAPGRMVGINDYGDRCYGIFAFRAPELDYDYRDLSAQKQLLLDAFQGMDDWQIPLLVRAVRDADDLYFDSVSQAHLPQWSSGRIVLVGDAAHAASLFSGRGTSLAMRGAEILAEELIAARGHHFTAFTAYEQRLRPLVTRAQSGVLDAREFMVPPSDEAIEARNHRFGAVAIDAS